MELHHFSSSHKSVKVIFAQALKTSGTAEVTAIGECPAIVEGKGQVVIGRFVSRDVVNLKCVCLEDGSSFTGTTTHPVWSVDASDWRRIDELATGETVKTLDGTLRITDIRSGQPSSDVFNIEVSGDHVYRLLSTGILVHNNAYPNLDIGHILQPIIKNGKVNGGHSIHSLIGGLGSVVKVLGEFNAQGAYKAIVEVADGAGGYVRAVKSMFPDSWHPNRILDEIDDALQGARPHPTEPNGLLGTGPSGLEITMFTRNGVVVTAYPHLS